MMEEVEFLFKCVEEGKLSKERASAILGKSQGKAKSTSASPAASTTGALKRPIEHKVYFKTLIARDSERPDMPDLTVSHNLGSQCQHS